MGTLCLRPRNLSPETDLLYVPTLSRTQAHSLSLCQRGFVLFYQVLKSRQTEVSNSAHIVSEVSLKLEKGEERMMQKRVGEGTLAGGILSSYSDIDLRGEGRP